MGSFRISGRPNPGDVAGAGSRYQAGQTLVAGRIRAIVQIVAVEHRFLSEHIGLRLYSLGLVGRTAQILHDDRRQQADDQDTTISSIRVNPGSDLSRIPVAHRMIPQWHNLIA